MMKLDVPFEANPARICGGETHTTCPYCGVGCGVIVTEASDGSFSVRGDPEHPANYGRLCSKGSALGDVLTDGERLVAPQIGERTTDWDEALELVSSRFSETIRDHGPDSVAFYVSGQLLTEDYYVANKLMKGFIGSANIDTNSRLCMASSVAGHNRAFGADTVPGTYEDLELADLVILVGSNLAWCHPVLYQRLASAKEKNPRMRVVVVDPRRTATTQLADRHLAIRSDGDVALFLGLLSFLDREGLLDRDYVDTHTTGLDAALAEAHKLTEPDLDELTGLASAERTQFYHEYGATARVVTVYSQGVNQSVVGTDKVNAIINCHLATGRIGREGAGPFSVTGQPNAMGGREVGGLANMLAAHMDINRPEHRDLVQAYWDAPQMPTGPGLKAIDLFRAVEAGTVKALWIMATNPVDSLADAETVRAALAACPFVVVSDVQPDTDTCRIGDVRLPAAAWGEKDGTVTNSERCISRQRAFRPCVGGARPDWWIISQVAKRMGFEDAFDFASPHEIFDEHAKLSGLDNAGTRDFDISGLSAMRQHAYNALGPTYWPVHSPAVARTPHPPAGGATTGLGTVSLDVAPARSAPIRFFADGGFYTPDRRGRLVPVAAPVRSINPELGSSWILNTGRVRDQWHTMTRTGRSARLCAHLAEPFVEIHPDDAAQLGLRDAEIAKLTSPHGAIFVRALLGAQQRRGNVFVPMHWTDQFASQARVGTLIQSATDPVSGQPALKSQRVAIERFDAKTYGFVVSRDRPKIHGVEYWSRSPAEEGWRAEFATQLAIDEVLTRVRPWLAPADALPEALEMKIPAEGIARLALFQGEQLFAAVYLAREPVAVSRSWATAQLTETYACAAERQGLLAARPRADTPDPGALVCSCFSVGVNAIASAIVDHGCEDVGAVGKVVNAGTNCGSCRSEIQAIIETYGKRQRVA